MQPKAQPVLLVEDQPDEAEIFVLACKQAGIANPIVSLSHGAEAVAYLSNPDHQRPCLLITDIRMPWMDGFELLQWVNVNCPKAEFPSVVLTSSPNAIDSEHAYNFGASDFYTKPATFDDTVETLRKIKRAWLDGDRPPQANHKRRAVTR